MAPYDDVFGARSDPGPRRFCRLADGERAAIVQRYAAVPMKTLLSRDQPTCWLDAAALEVLVRTWTACGPFVGLSMVSKKVRAVVLPVLEKKWLGALTHIWASGADPSHATPSEGFACSAFATSRNLQHTRSTLKLVLPNRLHCHIDDIIRAWGVHDLLTSTGKHSADQGKRDAAAEVMRVINSRAPHVLVAGYVWDRLVQGGLRARHLRVGNPQAPAAFWEALGVSHAPERAPGAAVSPLMIQATQLGRNIRTVRVVRKGVKGAQPVPPPPHLNPNQEDQRQQRALDARSAAEERDLRSLWRGGPTGASLASPTGSRRSGSGTWYSPSGPARLDDVLAAAAEKQAREGEG